MRKFMRIQQVYRRAHLLGVDIDLSTKQQLDATRSPTGDAAKYASSGTMQKHFVDYKNARAGMVIDMIPEGFAPAHFIGEIVGTKEEPDCVQVRWIRRVSAGWFSMPQEEQSRKWWDGGQAEPTITQERKPVALTPNEMDLVLFDLLHTTKNTPLFRLAKVMMRIECLSHVLVWTDCVPNKYRQGLHFLFVELPRLANLEFFGKVTATGKGKDRENGVMHLHLVDRPDLFVADQGLPDM
eukprot:gene56651-biopygen56679